MNRRRMLSIVFGTLLGVSAAWGCSTASGAEADEQTGDEQVVGERDNSPPMDRPMSREQMMEICPMQLEGTSMSMELEDDAVAIDYTTDGDVDELRRRVEAMAERHNQRMEQGAGMHHGGDQMHRGDDDMHRGDDDGHHGDGDEHHAEMHEEMMETMMETTAETEEINRGMRMRLVPEDPEEAQELYDAMQQRMQQGRQQSGCPMMEMMEGMEEMEGGEN